MCVVRGGVDFSAPCSSSLSAAAHAQWVRGVARHQSDPEKNAPVGRVNVKSASPTAAPAFRLMLATRVASVDLEARLSVLKPL